MLLKANGTAFKNGFAIYVGNRVSLAHDVMVHGPAYIGDDTFVGMKSMIFNVKVGNIVVIGVSSTITNASQFLMTNSYHLGVLLQLRHKQTNYLQEWGVHMKN